MNAKVFTKQTLILLALLTLFAEGAAAQGARYDNWVQLPNGQAVVGATVTVCSYQVLPAVITAPCSPTINIYNDVGLMQLITPQGTVITDQGGNYGWFAAATNYVYTITGSGFNPIGRYVTPGTGGGGGGGIPSVNGTTNQITVTNPTTTPVVALPSAVVTPGTLSATTVSGGNVAIKPGTGGPIVYVCSLASCPGASDSNDGTSWGSAKLTVYGAWTALSRVGCNFGPTCGGFIYISDNVTWGGPVSGQGLQIIGAHDPNFTSPPSGWVKESATSIICAGSGSWDSTAAKPACLITGQNSSHPGIWISGNTAPMYFEGIKTFTGSYGLLLSMDSNGVFENQGAATNVTFTGCSFGVNGTVTTNGPGVRIGPNSFEIYFYDDVFDANSTATTGSPQHQAMVIDPGGTGNNNSGDVNIFNSHANGGSIYINDNGQGASGIAVTNLVCEGQTDGHGCVWIPITNVNSGYDITNIQVADALPASPGVEVDGNGPTDGVVVKTTSGSSGPMTLLGNAPANQNGLVVTPDRQHVTGFMGGHVLGQVNAARRGFGPTAVPFLNLAATSPATWTFNGNGVITTGITAPDGTTGAGECSSTLGTANCFFYNTNQTYAVGDIIIVGVWAQARTALGFSGSQTVVFTTPFCASPTCIYNDISGTVGSGFIQQYILGDANAGAPSAEWEFYWKVYKVAATGGVEQTQFAAVTDATHPANYYAPMLLHIPANAISDNEAAELGLNLQPYSNLCAVGTMCGLAPLAISKLDQKTASQFAGISACVTSTKAITFPTAYTSQPVILVFDETTAGGVILSAKSASGFTVTCTGATDAFDWMAVGNPN
jgi:hypothetical protein